MHTDRTSRIQKSTTRGSHAPAGLLLVALVLAFPIAAAMQAPASTERARVPTSHANVHMGPGSGQEVLILVAKGTVLPVIGRSGEWVQVQLSPELRKTGMVMRWYKNETSGWMHDSTVEIIKAGTQ